MYRRSRFGSIFVVTILVGLLGLLHASSDTLPTAAHEITRPETLWGDTRPPRVDVEADPKSVELGTVFAPRADGQVLGIRYWSSSMTTEGHVGNLWDGDGSLLATADFDERTETGWRKVMFASPVEVSEGEKYTASYFAPEGNYSATVDSHEQSSSDMLAVVPGVSGRYTYSSTSTLPTSTWRSSQYWVDVLFMPDGTSIPTPEPSPVPPPGPEPADPATPPRRINCAPDPSACGYPDATNTGPQDGAPMTRVPQDRTSGDGWSYDSRNERVLVTGRGATLDRLDITGGVVIDAPDVTLSNSRVRACGSASESDVVALRVRPEEGFSGNGASIIDNVLDGLPDGCSFRARSGVRDIHGAAKDVLVDGNDISGTSNGITIEYEGLIQNNWVHDLAHAYADHHSGISTHGGAKQVTMRHNTVLLGYEEMSGKGGVSGAITNYADFAHSQNVTVEDNLISGGAYTVYGGNSGNEYSSPSTNIKIRLNRFVCGEWAYGPIASFDADSPGNVWSGNVCDGTNLAVER